MVTAARESFADRIGQVSAAAGNITTLIAVFLLISVGCSQAASGRDAVSALGFVEPLGGVVKIGGSTSSRGAIISELFIEEGDVVEEGQVLAIDDMHESLLANLKLVEAEVDIRAALLNQVKAGASKGTIKAQKAEIERLKIEIETAEVINTVRQKNCAKKWLFRMQNWKTFT